MMAPEETIAAKASEDRNEYSRLKNKPDKIISAKNGANPATSLRFFPSDVKNEIRITLAEMRGSRSERYTEDERIMAESRTHLPSKFPS